MFTKNYYVMKNTLISLSLIVSLFFVFSCVPLRKFEEVKANRDTCDVENKLLKDENRKLTVDNTELFAKNDKITRQLLALQNDTAIQGKTLRQLTSNYNQVSETYNLLLTKNKELLAGNADETRKIMAEMQKQQAVLQKQEDKLKIMEDSIDRKTKSMMILGQQLLDSRKALDEKEALVKEKENEIQTKQTQLEAKQAEINEKQARLTELENILAQKDAAVSDLKNKVSKALFNFENNGLTIEQRNGKVYVSMDEKLLFKSGSYDVDVKGQEALKQLAKVLEQNADVNILIEGHTDDVPLKGSGVIKDNWDLSVMRATSVVKILLSGSNMNPARISAAGRSQYIPLQSGTTPEVRSKNRRTEIILTPKLDELLKVLETN